MTVLRAKVVSLLLSTILLALPAMTKAQTLITMCAHPQGKESYFMDVDISVSQDGAIIDISSQKLTDKCYRIEIPICDDATKIEVISGRTYKGASVCKRVPSPMLIAMKASREVVVTALFGSLSEKWNYEFGSADFFATISGTEEALTHLSNEAKTADFKLYTALATNDYATAQQQANKLAEYLQLAGNERLSLAYHSITYVTGFRAIGFNALAEDNPLVTTVGSPDPSFVVMSAEGKKILGLYQRMRLIRATPGVWDHPTSTTVSTIKSSLNGELIAAPTELNPDDFFIEDSGRMILR